MTRILILLMVLMSYVFPAYASNDPWYDAGQAAGQIIGASIFSGSPGTDSKNFYKDENYNFSNIKKIVLISTVPKQAQAYVDDPYLENKYPGIFASELKETNIIFVPLEKVLNDFYQTPESRTAPKDDPMAPVRNYLKANYDAILSVYIYAYNMRSGNTGNCALDFKMLNTINGADILYYKDFRLNAPRSWPEGMIKRITGQFKNKLIDAINNSKKPN